MSIPKKIHYCWFGKAELPELVIFCINSWKKYCPDYEIICWNESNIDIESCLFIQQAYSEKKWAFVSDYIRLKVIEEHGGIYLDTDVELIKSLDSFLNLDGFMGFEESKPYYLATGLGFGAIKGHSIIKLLMDSYEKTEFIKPDGCLDLTPCPVKDTHVLNKVGLLQNNLKQNIQGVHIFPTDFFCPVSILGQKNFTKNTVSIHHFHGSWLPENKKNATNRKKLLVKKFGLKFGIVINYMFTALDELIEFGWKALFKRSLRFLMRIKK